MAGTKKKSSKKKTAKKKSSRKKTAAKKAATTKAMTVKRSPGLVKLAKFTARKEKKLLRKTFCVGDFNDAFDKEFKAHPGDLDKLTAKERAFCQGWLQLARLQCQRKGPKRSINDAKLIGLIEGQLNPPWPHTGTG